MTGERHNPFDVGELLGDQPAKPAQPRPPADQALEAAQPIQSPPRPTATRPDLAMIDRVAKETGFVSRQAPRGPRYRTGRNRQLNLKVTEGALSRFYAVADAMNEPLGAVFERAVEALEEKRRRS